MNVEVGVSAISVTLSGTLLEVNVSTVAFFIGSSRGNISARPCPSSTIISINGHSLSAINPDFIKAGESTTLSLA